jgi:hypothetical protein
MMTVQHCPIINVPVLFQMRTEKIADVHLFDFDLYNRTTKWAPILRHVEAQR